MRPRSDVDAERAFWDAATERPDGGRLAIWGEPGRWESRIAECVDACVRPALDILPPGRAVAPDLRVVDIGCGIGRMAIPVARMLPHAEVIGVGVSPKMLSGMAAEAAAAGIDNLRGEICDGRSLPAGLAPVDMAYSMVVFQHIPWEAVVAYVQAVAAVLRVGGVLRFQFVEGSQSEFLGNHFRVADVLDAVERSGLHVVSLERGLIYEQWAFVSARKES